jgi:hypothetical protein
MLTCNLYPFVLTNKKYGNSVPPVVWISIWSTNITPILIFKTDVFQNDYTILNCDSEHLKHNTFHLFIYLFVRFSQFVQFVCWVSDYFTLSYQVFLVSWCRNYHQHLRCFSQIYHEHWRSPVILIYMYCAITVFQAEFCLFVLHFVRTLLITVFHKLE